MAQVLRLTCSSDNNADLVLFLLTSQQNVVQRSLALLLLLLVTLNPLPSLQHLLKFRSVAQCHTPEPPENKNSSS